MKENVSGCFFSEHSVQCFMGAPQKWFLKPSARHYMKLTLSDSASRGVPVYSSGFCRYSICVYLRSDAETELCWVTWFTWLKTLAPPSSSLARHRVSTLINTTKPNRRHELRALSAINRHRPCQPALSDGLPAMGEKYLEAAWLAF